MTRVTPVSLSAGSPGSCARAAAVRLLSSTGVATAAAVVPLHSSYTVPKGSSVGSVIKKRRKRMAKKKHRKLLKKTRVQRRRLGK